MKLFVLLAAIIAVDSFSTENSKASLHRRTVLANIVTASTGVVSAYSLLPVQNAHAIRLPGQGPLPLFKICEQLETANDIGKVGVPKFQPNSRGAPEKHLPKVQLDGQSLTVSANHVMTPEHYIQFMWLKDAKTNEVVLAKQLSPSEDTPVLTARVPSGVTLRPYLFCNLHGLWKGEEFYVS